MPTPDRYCEITVACAAPATPSFKPMTNQRSRIILSIDDTARSKSGITELPIALRYEAK